MPLTFFNRLLFRSGAGVRADPIKSTTVADCLVRAKAAPDGRSYRPGRSHTGRRRPRHIAGRVHRACRRDLWSRGRHLLASIWLGRRRLLPLVQPSARRTEIQTTCSSSRSTHTRPKQKPSRRAPTLELVWLLGQDANQSSRHHCCAASCSPLEDGASQANRQ